MRAAHFLPFLLFLNSAFGESGSGSLLLPGETYQPASPQQISRLNTCYVRLALSAKNEAKECEKIARESVCKMNGTCKWKRSSCLGIGFLQCRETLNSLCSKIVDVDSKFPDSTVSLRRYECDPGATGRIIRLFKD